MPVYFAQAPWGGPVKIGFSEHPEERVADLSRDARIQFRLVAVMPGATGAERGLHDRFAESRVRPFRGRINAHRNPARKRDPRHPPPGCRQTGPGQARRRTAIRVCIAREARCCTRGRRWPWPLTWAPWDALVSVEQLTEPDGTTCHSVRLCGHDLPGAEPLAQHERRLAAIAHGLACALDQALGELVSRYLLPEHA